MIEKRTYNWKVYSRNTNAKGSKKYYFRANSRSPQGEILLHRQIWVDVNGPIPFMHVIHHIDGNTANNNVSNLMCISERDHLRADIGLHGSGWRKKNTIDEAVLSV
jgi:hypothetical protein